MFLTDELNIICHLCIHCDSRLRILPDLPIIAYLAALTMKTLHPHVFF